MGLITGTGQLWMWGQNDRRQLGLGPDAPSHVASPQLVKALDGSEGGVVQVSLGGFHSAVVSDRGVVFTWGDNKRGQCGQGEVGLVEVPTRLLLESLEGRCVGIALGGHFSLFETEGRRVYACGWGKEGCLGFGQLCKRLLTPRR